jgi:hypothetical protein
MVFLMSQLQNKLTRHPGFCRNDAEGLFQLPLITVRCERRHYKPQNNRKSREKQGEKPGRQCRLFVPAKCRAAQDMVAGYSQTPATEARKIAPDDMVFLMHMLVHDAPLGSEPAFPPVCSIWIKAHWRGQKMRSAAGPRA